MTPAERIQDLEETIADLKARRLALPPTGSDNVALVAKVTTAVAMAHRELNALYTKQKPTDDVPPEELETRALEFLRARGWSCDR